MTEHIEHNYRCRVLKSENSSFKKQCGWFEKSIIGDWIKN